MEKINIKDARIADEIRKQMATTTFNDNGLMNKDFISSNGAFSTGSVSFFGDLNTVHNSLKNGISVIACGTASTNRPYPDDQGGILINVNRTDNFSVKVTYQIYISVSKGYIKKSRKTYLSGTDYIFTPWE